MVAEDRTVNHPDIPYDLAEAIREFFPEQEWDNAARVSWLESGWTWTAELNTTSGAHPCGSIIGVVNGVNVSAERSIGYFQINACNLAPGWRAEHLWNTRHNVGTAHHLFTLAGGWSPWYFSATWLGLL